MKITSASLLIIIIMIPLLAVATYAQLRAAAKEMQNAKIDIPEVKIPDANSVIEDIQTKTTGTNYQEFTAPGEKFTLRYGQSWMGVDASAFGEAQKNAAADEKLLLLRYKIDINGFSPSYFVVERVSYNTWDALIERIQNDAQKNGKAMEIVKSDTAAAVKTIETRTTQTATSASSPAARYYARNAIIFDGDGAYLISITTTESNWPSIDQEAQAIIDSIMLAENPGHAQPAPPNSGQEPPVPQAGGNVNESISQ